MTVVTRPAASTPGLMLVYVDGLFVGSYTHVEPFGKSPECWLCNWFLDQIFTTEESVIAAIVRQEKSRRLYQ